MLTPPYYPASNGLAERAVGLVKDRLKKMNCSAAPIQLDVGLKFICRVHGLTPHRSTGRCPYELHREGPGASLFPLLTSSSKHGCSRRSEQTAVSHSVGRLARKGNVCRGRGGHCVRPQVQTFIYWQSSGGVGQQHLLD